MACDTCGARIAFKATRADTLSFCGEACREQGHLVRIARGIPSGVVTQQAAAIYHGACPKCGGTGPVDVRISYLVWSVLIETSWKNTAHIACRRCGLKSQMRDALLSALFGWWAVPGLLMTPIQLGRNINAALSRGAEHGPSKRLEQSVRMMRAERIWESTHPFAPLMR